MKEEYKEILTIDKIKLDNKKGFFRETAGILMFALVVFLFLCFILLIFPFFKNTLPYLIFFIFLIVTLVFIIVISILSTLDAIKNYICIQKGNFFVMTEALVDKKAEIISRYSNRSRPHTLIFPEKREYYITRADNYPSSEMYSMYKDSVFRSSDIGDKFYLIVNKKNQILLAYNTKFFIFRD